MSSLLLTFTERAALGPCEELTAIIYYYLILNNYYSCMAKWFKEQHSVCPPLLCLVSSR